MSNLLVEMLRTSDINRIIIEKVKKHGDVVGHTVDNDDKEVALEETTKEAMRNLVSDMSKALEALNELFIDKNLTAKSAEDYLRFLSDLLPDYMLVPSYENLSSLSNLEIESLVEAQSSYTSTESMIEGLVEYAFLKQGEEDNKTKEQILAEYKELDKGTITSAYKTLLHKQLVQVSK
jgi:hypothetical protein